MLLILTVTDRNSYTTRVLWLTSTVVWCASLQYHNIFALLKDLGRTWPLTDWTTSGFWSPYGLTTEAPIFSRQTRLPTLIGQFVHTAPLYWALPLQERLTMLPFLLSFADFDATPEVYER